MAGLVPSEQFFLHLPPSHVLLPAQRLVVRPGHTYTHACVATRPSLSSVWTQRPGRSLWQPELWVWSRHVDVCGLALGPHQPQEVIPPGPTLCLKVTGSSSWENLL